MMAGGEGMIYERGWGRAQRMRRVTDLAAGAMESQNGDLGGMKDGHGQEPWNNNHEGYEMRMVGADGWR